MLLELKSFIQAREVVTMQELLINFNIGEYNMRRILQNWIKKGVLNTSKAVEPCCVKRTGCNSCALLALEFYSIKV